MKSLLLMRHSFAVSNNPAYSDRERPLTEHGRRIAQDTAMLLQQFHIDRIICSSATRTLQTADIIASVGNATVHAVDELYLARSIDYRNAATDLACDADDTILVVGHNPGIASLIMSWADESLFVPPCTVAKFDVLIDNWPDLKTTQPELTDFISGGKRESLP